MDVKVRLACSLAPSVGMVRALSSLRYRRVPTSWMNAMPHLESAGVCSGKALGSLRGLQEANRGAVGFRLATSLRKWERRPRSQNVVCRQASDRGTSTWDEAADAYFSGGTGDQGPVQQESARFPPKRGMSQSWKQVLAKARAGQGPGVDKKEGAASWNTDRSNGAHSSSRFRRGEDRSVQEKRGEATASYQRRRDGEGQVMDNVAFAAREWGDLGSSDREGVEDGRVLKAGSRRSLGKSSVRRDQWRPPSGKVATSWDDDDEDGDEDMEEEEEVEEGERRAPRGRGYRTEYTEQSNSLKAVGEAVYGVNPIQASLQACRRKFHTLYVQVGMEEKLATGKRKDKAAVAWVLNAAKSMGLQTVVTSKHNLNLLVENRPHQGLVLDASPLELVLIEGLERPELQEGGRAPVWVALDEIMDPQNFGAILRSAFFLGADGVVVCAKNSAPLSGVVSKASAGALEVMEVQCCKNMVRFLDRSVQNGWQAVGASADPRARSVWDLPPAVPTILVLGNEGKGLRTNVRRACTETVRIVGAPSSDISFPQTLRIDENHEVVPRDRKPEVESLLRPAAAVDSLNVSVAAGILLHQLLTRPVGVQAR